MKKLAIKSIPLLFAAITLFSCNKFLDIKPKGFTIPENYDDYFKIMNYAQLAKAGDSYPAIITDDAQFSSGDSINNYASLDESDQRLYSFKGGAVFNDGVSDGLWEYSYNRIYAFNIVINNIMKVTDASEAKKKMLKSEALVARAFEYLTLISAYAKAYDPATASTDYGVPIIESEDVGNLDYVRNSTAEVYAKIQSDLDEALPNLLDAVPNSFRPAKNVAYAFRARMHLYKGEFDKALENAKSALELNNKLIDLTQYGIKPGDISIGRIVKLPQLTTPYPEGLDNIENIYSRYAPYVFGLNASVFASNDLLNVYKKDLPNGQVDKRRALWFSDNKFSTYDFPGRTIWCQYTRANFGLSNMEVLLIAAECYARAGGATNLTEAAKLYNLLRRNRILNYTDVTFANADDALVKVLEERRREFPFLGTYRFVDLKRLNREPRFAKTITHTADGQTWTLPPNDLRYVLPIPPKVKTFKPNLPDYQR